QISGTTTVFPVGSFGSGTGGMVVGTMVITGGTVGGTGTITGNVLNTSGTFGPGSSPGILTINGDYTQSASGVLNIEIGGTIAATPDFDQLIISGKATLDGTLNVSLINGFTPALGNNFQFMTYGSRSGDFSFTTGLSPFFVRIAGPTTMSLQTVVAMVTNAKDSATGSLRQAILDSNAHPGADAIYFNIAGAGVHTIQPTSALPIITDAVTLDATTQPGFAGTPIIELDGTAAGLNTYGVAI